MLKAILQEKVNSLPRLTAAEVGALEKQFFTLMTNAHFVFKTFYQARQLAFYLSFMCPESSKAAVGLSELFINAIEHGNLNITWEEKNSFKNEKEWLDEVERRLGLPINEKKLVQLELIKHSNFIEFIIQDEGTGFNWKEYVKNKEINPDIKNGRGIILARLMSFDELHYNDSGNQVTGIIYRQ